MKPTVKAVSKTSAIMQGASEMISAEQAVIAKISTNQIKATENRGLCFEYLLFAYPLKA